MRINIECEYCGSVYDYEEHRVCPNCAAVPNKKIIADARAAAKAELKQMQQAQQAAVPAAAPTGKLMRAIIKLVPLWIGIIVFSLFIPDITEKMTDGTAAEHLQTVAEPTYSDHGMGEEFLLDGIFSITADEAFWVESTAMAPLVPDGMKLLAVHIGFSSSGEKAPNLEYYYSNDPYIYDGRTCREQIDGYALDSYPDLFAQNSYSLSSMEYSRNGDGYMCFFADEDAEEIYLCFEESRTEGYVRQLEYIHRIKLDITEREETL